MLPNCGEYWHFSTSPGSRLPHCVVHACLVALAMLKPWVQRAIWTKGGGVCRRFGVYEWPQQQ